MSYEDEGEEEEGGEEEKKSYGAIAEAFVGYMRPQNSLAINDKILTFSSKIVVTSGGDGLAQAADHGHQPPREDLGWSRVGSGSGIWRATLRNKPRGLAAGRGASWRAHSHLSATCSVVALLGVALVLFWPREGAEQVVEPLL